MLFFTVASLALSAVAGVSAIAIPHNHVYLARASHPADYAEGYLEDYTVYHTRYLALDCEAQHNTSFFDKCCHPLLASETLAKNRAPECNPANHASSTISSAAPTATDDDGDDCDDDEPTSSSSVKASSSQVALTHSTHSITLIPSSATHSTPATTETPSSTKVSTTQTPTTTKVSTTAKPSTTQAPTTTKASSAPAATTTSSSSGTFSGGHATFFYQGGNAGACGQVHSDNSFIAALQTKRYGNLSAESSNCGRKITLTNTNNGKSVTVTVADACPTCGNQNDLDLSFAAFTTIATEEEGEVPITWHFDD